MHKIETICALATAIGQSGIGVIRVSGPLSKVIANKVLMLNSSLGLPTMALFIIKKVIKLIKVSPFISLALNPTQGKMY